MLTDRGLANVTVLERAARVGGKSLTVQHEGLGHELGTCYHTYGYTYVRAWMRQFGIGAHRLNQHVIHRMEGGPIDFKSFVVGGDRRRAYSEVLRYIGHWLRFFWRQEAGRSRATFDAEVSIPFLRWLRQRDLGAVERFALRSMTAMGYGHLEEVPALYGLRWNMPSLLLSAAATRVDEPVPGWMQLWEALAWTLDVRLGWEIARVERSGDRFAVRGKHGETLHFDHLVVSTPLDEVDTWMEPTPAERRLFGRVRWAEYASSLVVVDGWFTDADTHSFEANLRGAEDARRGNLLVARRTADKTAVAGARSRSRKNVYVTYQYGSPQMSESTLRARLEGDVGRQGGRVVEVLSQARWKYAPKLTPEAIASGAVWEMEALQGQQNTWYTGASFSHESVDNIVDYNVKLADRMEAAIRGRAGLPFGGWMWEERRRLQRMLTWHNK
jgi:predicted NAD/FAD-binding protein